MDIRATKQWGLYLKTLSWKSIGAIRIRPLLFFSIIKLQRPLEITKTTLKEIDKQAKKHKALFVKVEPSNEKQALLLKENGYKKDNWPLVPPKTIFIDLTSSLDEISKHFNKDARYCLRKALGNNLGIRVITNNTSFTEEDADTRTPLQHKNVVPKTPYRHNPNNHLHLFYKLWQQTGKRGKFYVPPYRELQTKANVFGKDCLLVLVKDSKSNKLLSGAFLIIHNSTCVYLHAASSVEGQAKNAPYLCLWECIREAKKRKCKTLDLEGIYDERFKKMTKQWQGFTRFKRKWGGTEYEFPGAYTKYTWFGLRA